MESFYPQIYVCPLYNTRSPWTNLKEKDGPVEQRTLKNVNNFLNTNIFHYIEETFDGQSSNLY
jgi:hypothetical protein